jgi:hypothetical protein
MCSHDITSVFVSLPFKEITRVLEESMFSWRVVINYKCIFTSLTSSLEAEMK